MMTYMKNYIRILTMITALMFGAANGAWALTNDDIVIDVKPGASAGNISKSVSGREVTLTVTPATGYYIKASDIVAEKLVDPGRFQAPKHRTPDFADVIPGKMYSGSGRTDADIISSVKGPNSAQYVFTVPTDYDGAYVTATFHLETEGDIIRITASTSLGDNPDMTKHYVLVEDVSASVLAKFNSTTPFTGIFEGEAKADGTFPKITGLSTPLFNTLTGTVKNIMLEGVGISNHTGNTGAIACTANGAARIYNVGILSGSVGGTGNTGGLVGLLDGTSRVINCYSFANIASGTNVAGIVGNNNQTSSQTALNTIVVNCMFYGNITGGTSVYPVYGGKSINNDSNTGINPYCYFRKNATLTPTAYNRSWPAEEKNLTRFEYYRSVLNSNRKLCTWWVNGTSGTAPTDEDVANVGIAKWVLDPSIAPYPILKKWGKYPSVINLDPDKVWDPRTEIKEGDAVTSVTPHWVQRSDAKEWEGKSYGTLAVTIKAGAHGSGSTSRNIPITDMDTLNCDYSYYKIQLPYYNEVFGNPNGATHAAKYGGNYTEYVVTGWEIAAAGSTTATDYNFADRNSINGRVFAQGGYYYVPKDVTSITITARWGKAIYLSNRGYSIDRVNVTKADFKSDSPFSPAGIISDTFQGQPVYDDLQNAIKALGTNTDYPTVYDQAIVLIGNHQVKNGNNDVGYNLDNKWHPFTIMSADFDFDNEPDYSFQFQFRNQTPRPGIQPIRFDFLPVVELGLAVRHNNLAYAIGIFVPQGHFEVTETAFMRTTQFEYDGFNSYTDKRIETKSPVIINGGEYEMFTVRYHDSNRTSYFLLGGNAWIHRFAPGAHPSMSQSPKIYLCPINVIGGQVKELYLTGLYRAALAAPTNQGAPRCYTDGGKFDIMAGAGYDKVEAGSNVTFKINHSKITEFYGGGINGSNPISGDIDVTIDNSYVDKYCGGPKVGDMTGKTVTTHATGTTFGVFFGGGNGGNSYYRQLQKDGDQNSSHIGTWTDQGYNWNNFNPLGVKDDGTDNKGYHAEYEFEVFNHSNGVTDQITQRGFIRWIQFGITKTGNVSSTLSDCKILGNFYGGGNLATVDGNVTSTLTNTQVAGSVFGAGYSAAIPTFQVHDKSTASFPSITAGVITDGYIGYDSKVYEWTNEKLEGKDEAYMKAHPTYEKDGKWYCYTWNSLDDLGAVTGTATLTIDGTTTVAHSVYGGGEESAVGGNTVVNINGGTIGTDNSEDDYGNVFGGGKLGLIENNTTVTISGGSVNQSVYGGGCEADVKGNTNVSMTDGYIFNGIFGGGLSGSVGTFTRSTEAADVNIFGHTAHEGCIGKPISCEANTGKCTIVVSGGQIGPIEVATEGMKRKAAQGGPVPEGWVWGAGRGLVEDPETHPDTHFTAYVNETDVTIEGNAFVLESIIGGGEFGRVLGDTNVKIEGGQIGVGANQTEDGKPKRYPNEKFVDPNVTPITNENALVPCSHYQYGKVVGGKTIYETYDPYADEYKANHSESLPTGLEGGSTDNASDGKTWIGCVFGGGSGYFPYKKTDTDGKITGYGWVESAGWVEGNANLTISGGHILSNVYGANEYTTVQGKSTVKMTGGTIGVPRTQAQIAEDPKIGHLFGGGKGDPRPYFKNKTNAGSVEVAVSGGIIYGSVFGGGESGTVKGGVTVTMTGGTVLSDVYGGGALADTQTDNWDETKNSGAGDWATGKTSASSTTTVRLTGGDILGEAYGGGLGETGSPAYVYGDVLLDLNGTTTSGETGTTIGDDKKGCTVNQVFGCNNAAGSPMGEVLVHIYATQNKTKSQIGNTDGETPVTDAKVKGSYDVTAVYGGGNLAAYEPAGGKETTNSTNVIIDGCGLTSIQTVYGGGNAASTPATNVTVNGTYEILELFGGGNGLDNLPDGRPNPGANVGYKNYTVYTKDGDDWVARDSVDYDTKEERTASTSGITYGTGQASINVYGGTVHRVFGGSNTKGNVRQTAVTLLDENSGCEFCVDEAYGGGKSAPMDAEAKLLMACIPGLRAAYGGAEAAAIKGNVTLNITNGTFDRVFGGNNLSGTIDGSITVNIEEVGCRPIKIGELYGGGNLAGYSVNGYNDDGTPKESGPKLYEDPQVNVMSFTSIGKVFGGGFGSGATMVGNPTVNVNEVYGRYYNDDRSIVAEGAETPNHYPIPSHAKGKMGAIHTVFGGGNAAKVMGNTTVNIATQAEVYIVKEVTAGAALPEGCYTRSGAGTTASPFVYTTATGTASADVTYYEKKDVLGVDIRDNVYGGGNNAEVTGNTNVNIGKRAE